MKEKKIVKTTNDNFIKRPRHHADSVGLYNGNDYRSASGFLYKILSSGESDRHHNVPRRHYVGMKLEFGSSVTGRRMELSFKRFAYFLIFALVPSLPGWADQPNTTGGGNPFAGQATNLRLHHNLYESGDFKGAFRLFKQAAEKGDRISQYRVAYMYLDGLGTPRNNFEALKWFRVAAARGNAKAQDQLAVMLLKGQGTPRDVDGAIKFFRLAAEKGVVSAQVSLARIYDKNGRAPANPEEALNWFRKAAVQGNAYAQARLGDIYISGAGVPKNSAKAAKWYRKAAVKGDAVAQVSLGRLFFSGQDPSQNAGEAASWIRKGAEQGNSEALAYLGELYEKGQGVPADAVSAYTWFYLAAARLPDGTRRDHAARKIDELAKNLTPASLAEAQMRAREWKPTWQ